MWQLCLVWGQPKRVGMKVCIIVIEGKRTEPSPFVSGLARKGYQTDCVASGSEAILRLKSEPQPALVIIHAVAMRTSGRRTCQSLRKADPHLPLVLITDAESADSVRKDGLAEVVLTPPFSLQKLMNRIRPLLPTATKEILQLGDLTLDVVQRRARLGERQATLSPRLVHLLKMLMERPGQVILREELFRAVWDTEYTVDMRSLDVHISWLRRALENDPRHPQYILTERGVGYRLVIDPPLA